MALKITPKASYSFEMNPTVTVEDYQTIRGTKDGVEVALTVPVKAIDGGAEVKPAKPATDDLDKFKANIEKGKIYVLDGVDWTVTKAGKKQVTLDTEDETYTCTPDELFNESE